ncbi:hypothetical protein OGAPHI_000288 [Ogataea philodendri]|uniref:Uncharacterized protein n=1 Tax=Ogataea philodendri TaxID=1378263 RepID=A0A9P8TAQ6_9ASCO|nr:uncharacterized protein OGAPHI_000288 [Ogataea philodendri]KAH3671585.1 hypothetical protein OGAPHI_000288 [Ogataea philodendri]
MSVHNRVGARLRPVYSESRELSGTEQSEANATHVAGPDPARSVGVDHLRQMFKDSKDFDKLVSEVTQNSQE